MTTTYTQTARLLTKDNTQLQQEQQVSSNINIELIMLYFHINKDLLLKSTHPLASIIVNKLLTHEYVIEDDHIVGTDFTLSIDTLLGVINYLEEIRPTKNAEPLNDCEIKPYTIQDRGATVHLNGLTLKEQREMVERFLNATDMTSNYITRTTEVFNDKASTTIVNLLSNQPTEELPRELIIALMNLYPMLYIKDRIEVPYDGIPMPKYAIALRTSTYDDEYVNAVEANIQRIYATAISLIKRTKKYGYVYEDGEEILEFNPAKLPLTPDEIIIQNRLKKLNAEIHHQSSELYFYKLEDRVFSKNYLDNIIKCIQYNGIELTYMDGEPIVILFYIENNKVKFHSKLLLRTLQKLVPLDTIANILQEAQVLKKEDLQ